MLHHLRMALYDYVVKQVKTIPNEKIQKNLFCRAGTFKDYLNRLDPEGYNTNATVEDSLNNFRFLLSLIADKKKEIDQQV